MDDSKNTVMTEVKGSILEFQQRPFQSELTDYSLKMKELDNQGKKDERGWLGKLWGSELHSANNIAGLLIVLLVLICLMYTVWQLCVDLEHSHSKIKDFWTTLSSLITLSIGYIFGNKKHDNEKEQKE